jgi:hypothetical protein
MSTLASIDNSEMTFPSFHLNGNSPETLGNEYFAALQALGDFERKFYAVEFHQRDYYTLPPENWSKAIEERDEIKKSISKIRQYLEALTAHCFESARGF